MKKPDRVGLFYILSQRGRGVTRGVTERGYNGRRGGAPLSHPQVRHLPLNAGEKITKSPLTRAFFTPSSLFSLPTFP